MKMIKGFLLFFCVCMMGCLESPLLKHANAATGKIASNIGKYTSDACQFSFEAQNLCANMEWVKNPSDEEQGEFLLRFWDKNLGSENGPFSALNKTVAVKLWMPSMGHGSAPVKVNQMRDAQGKLIDGVYEAKEVTFVMPGKWEIWVQLKQDRNIVSQSKIEFEL